ncbi:hypothetical protein G4B88_001632 [Cannabis sativa]|uniref:lysine--tRNA ligase n=1 Tax=Cannabis sativa TaxID=3483 RepID=A0A7J6I361_CANSA|nr:hypothetical protein G4B88_001632 [Cannabis sativa]
MASKSQHQKKHVGEDDNMDPTQYLQNRLASLALAKAAGINPYPHKFTVSISVPELIAAYGSLDSGEHVETIEVSLAGRIMSKRASSSKLFFYDLYDDSAKVQVISDARHSNMDEDEFGRLHSQIKRGDIVGICGFPGKSKRGELSVFGKSLMVLAPCLHMLPKHASVHSSNEAESKSSQRNEKTTQAWKPGSARNPDTYALKDQETRYRQRYLDLMLNPEIQQVFKTRARILSYYRRFLDSRGFVEVETPVLSMVPGGAAAKPFVTYHNELETELYMRVSPELNLKKLVVGGLNRVYEIGKSFRNEGMDLTHLPEFTMCEFYMAYSDYNDLMKITEELLSGMVKELTGSYKIKYHGDGLSNEPIEIDFTPPFRRVDLIEELEKRSNLNIPKDLYSEESNKYLMDACQSFNVNCPLPRTTARLLDKLCNAYTELNDPEVQRRLFAEQLKERESGDEEAMVLDETFCIGLEYGLPPTGGMGMGIDRLTMLLTDSINVLAMPDSNNSSRAEAFKFPDTNLLTSVFRESEVILYPPMRSQEDNSSKV